MAWPSPPTLPSLDVARWLQPRHQQEPEPTGDDSPDEETFPEETEFDPVEESGGWEAEQRTLHALCDIDDDGLGDLLESVGPAGSDGDFLSFLFGSESDPSPTRLTALSGADFSPLWMAEFDSDAFWFRWTDVDGDGCDDIATLGDFAFSYEEETDSFADDWALTFYSTRSGARLFTARDGFASTEADDGSVGPAYMGTSADAFRITFPSTTGQGVEQRTTTYRAHAKEVYAPVAYGGHVEFSSVLEIDQLDAAGSTARSAVVEFPDHLAQFIADDDFTGDGRADRLLSSVAQGGAYVYPPGLGVETQTARVVVVDGHTLDVAWTWEGDAFFGRAVAVPAGSGDVLVIEFGYFSEDAFLQVATRHTFLDGATGEVQAVHLWPREHRVAFGFGDVDGDGIAELAQSTSPAASAPGFQTSAGRDGTVTLVQRDGSRVRAFPEDVFWFYDFWWDPAMTVAQRQWLLDFDGDGLPEPVSFQSEGPQIFSGATGSVLWDAAGRDFLSVGPVKDVLGGAGWDLLLATEVRLDGAEEDRRSPALGVRIAVLDGADFRPAWGALVDDGVGNTSWDVREWGFVAESTVSLTGAAPNDVVLSFELRGCRRPGPDCPAPTFDSRRSFVLDGATGAILWPAPPPLMGPPADEVRPAHEAAVTEPSPAAGALPAPPVWLALLAVVVLACSRHRRR